MNGTPYRAARCFALDESRLPGLLDGGAELFVFDAKPLYRLALEHGGVGAAIRFDGKLAAYLLNPSASDYQVAPLAAEYGVSPSFVCEEFPDAGVLAAVCDTLAKHLDEQGQHKLLEEMELPLARVLADMERIGFAVDAEGIRAFGDSCGLNWTRFSSASTPPWGMSQPEQPQAAGRSPL